MITNLEDLKSCKFELYESNTPFGYIRTIRIGENDFLFHGSDTALVLEYKDTTKAVSQHVPKAQRVKMKPKNFKTGESPVLKNIYKTGEIFITEEGLYRLITSSKMKKAEDFKSWVFGELLPTLRKKGSYTNEDLEQSKFYSTIKQLPGWNEDEVFKTKLKTEVSELSRFTHSLKSHVWNDFIRLYNAVYSVNLSLKITHFMKKNKLVNRPSTREYLDYSHLHRQAYIIFEMLRHGNGVKANTERLALMKTMCEIYYSYLTQEEKDTVDKTVKDLFENGYIKALPDDHFVKQYDGVSGDKKIVYVKFG